MKNILTSALVLLSTILFGQIPSANPSFTVVQQVGSGEVSFTYKQLMLNDRLESFLTDKNTFYPGGRTNFIIRLSKDIFINEQPFKSGSYVGGFKLKDGELALVIEQEEIVKQKKKEKTPQAKEIILLKTDQIDCNIEDQIFNILPRSGQISSSNILLILEGEAFDLSLAIDDSELITKIKKDISKADKSEVKKFQIAAQYCYDSNQNLEEATEWASIAYEQLNNWESGLLLAKLHQKNGDKTSALNLAKTSIELVYADDTINSPQKNDLENEIKKLMMLWMN